MSLISLIIFVTIVFSILKITSGLILRKWPYVGFFSVTIRYPPYPAPKQQSIAPGSNGGFSEYLKSSYPLSAWFYNCMVCLHITKRRLTFEGRLKTS